jgi:hypothetical protein
VRGSWDDVNRRLVGAMLALDLHDSLVVGDPRPRVRSGLFGRRSARVPRRFVQVTAARTVLIAECVGSPSIGGGWPMTSDQEEALLLAGWEKPWSEESHTFQREAPLSGAPRLALALVRALQTLACEVADLEVDLVREEPE